MILEPGNIHIAWRLDKVSKQRVGPYRERRHGSRIEPTMDFCMAVSEGEAASPMMIKAGQIIKAPFFRMIGVPFHVWGKISDVDAVLSHVEKEPRSARAGIDQIRHFEIQAPSTA